MCYCGIVKVKSATFFAKWKILTTFDYYFFPISKGILKTNTLKKATDQVELINKINILKKAIFLLVVAEFMIPAS